MKEDIININFNLFIYFCPFFSEDSYTVIDYALRDQIQVSTCQSEDLNLSLVKSPSSMLGSRQVGGNHLFRLGFRSNHSDSKVLMVLGTELL